MVIQFQLLCIYQLIVCIKYIKTMKAIILCLLISFVASQSLNIISAETIHAGSNLVGSHKGGTKIIFKGTGFDPDFTNIEIFVGDNQCHIEDGSTATQIACITSESHKYGNVNMEIRIQQGYVPTILPWKFTYRDDQTPQITLVWPLSSHAGDRLFFYGHHRIYHSSKDPLDEQDIIGLKVGDDLCDIKQISQQIIPHSINTIKCNSATEQQGGRKLVSEHVTPGYGNIKSYLTRVNWYQEQQQYVHAVIPGINSVYPNAGYLNGQEIYILGSGFSHDPEKLNIDIDGLDCEIISCTTTEIKCKLGPRSSAPSKQLQVGVLLYENDIFNGEQNETSGNQTDNLNISTVSQPEVPDDYTQINGFIGGSGFKYYKYDIGNLYHKHFHGLKNAVHTGSSVIKLIKEGTQSFLQYIQEGGLYGKVLKGYFYAPVTGPYIFRGAGDDTWGLFVSKYSGSAEVDPKPYIYSYQYTGVKNDYYYVNDTTALGEQLYMEAGKYYYMELYLVNTAGNGYVKISVQVPNDDRSLPNQRYEVNQIQTAYDNDPQIRKFTLNVSPGAIGTFQLEILRHDGWSISPSYHKIVNVPISVDGNAFTNYLGAFDTYVIKNTRVTRQNFNDFDEQVSVDLATKIVWTVEIMNFRSTAAVQQKFTYDLSNIVSNTPPMFTEEMIKEHGPHLGGSFMLEIGGYPLNIWSEVNKDFSNPYIPYNVHPDTLKAAFRQIPGYGSTNVRRFGDCRFGCTYLINYNQVTEDVPDFIFSDADLTGFNARISSFETLKYSSNVIVSPVDDRFLFSAMDSPQVIVTVNGVSSACFDDCSYEFIDDGPEVLTQTIINGNQLEVTVSNPQNETYQLDEINVKLNGLDCSNIAGTFISFTCDLAVNNDNTPIIEAGDHYVQIWVIGVGEIQLDQSLSPITAPLSILSISPTQGGQNGGIPIDITGVGFPKNGQGAQVELCNTIVQLESGNNLESRIISPKCTAGTHTLQYRFNELTAQITFDYVVPSTAITITSIIPSSHSPSEKGVMQIHGTNFPTDITTIKAHLSQNKENKYEMRVIESNGSVIKCGIPGGMAGDYEVIVTIDGQGNAILSSDTANDFSYQLEITGISPLTGSRYGGTLITITGNNFKPTIIDSMVTVGHELNTLCNIATITETQITCRTPTFNTYWKQNNQDIIYTSRLIADSVCSAPTCQFIYKDVNSSMTIQSISHTSILSGSGPITIQGKNFDLTSLSDVKVVLTNVVTGQQTEVIPISALEAYIIFDAPLVEAGRYIVKARLDPEGESNGKTIQILFNFAASSFDISTQGGEVSLSGKGLPAKWPNHFWSIETKFNGKFRDFDIVQTQTDSIVIQFPPGIAGQGYTIKVRNPINKVISTTVFHRTASTPPVTLTTVSPITPGTNTVEFSIDSTITQQPIKLFSFSTLDNELLSEETFTINGDTLSASMDLASGKYGFKMVYEKIGWANLNGELEVSQTGSYTVSNTFSSYAGGQLTITGSDISSHARIKIGGFQGKILRQDSASATFEVPPLITSQVLNWYPKLSSEKLIKPETTISDGGSSPENAFDGKPHTEYQSSNIDCFIGIDVGEHKLVNPKRIRYFPFSEWAVVVNHLKGAFIKGSVDNVNFDTLHVVGPSVHSGWNSFLINTDKNYRYFVLSHDDSSGCKIAQFEVHGLLYSDIIVSDPMTVDVQFDDGSHTQTWAGAVTYSKASTPEIVDIDKKTGDVFGGYQITLTGQNLGDLTILIDQIPCTVQSQSATSVTCEVGQRIDFPEEIQFDVSLNGNKAVINEQFIYVLRWSDIRTWGTDLPPVQNDIVHVPKGMTLYMDQSTPKLAGIIVEGKIIFADEAPLQIHTERIIIIRGQFTAGTKQKPYQNDLKFVMYGGYYGKQLPMFGNKGIGCLQCKFSMWGKVRPITWTVLDETTPINAGDTTFQVSDSNIDWEVGEKIVVASTDFDHNQAEERKIASISGTTITVDEPFQYAHSASVENYGTNVLDMRAEVGLLSRNIKMMGDPTSEAGQYGSHLMMAGSSENGMVSHIGYTEFTHCGQPRIVGRYCIHFHMNGDVAESQVTGNAVHHSFARVITIHAVHYLRVKDNVGYRVKGHNFFIEDGIETHNILDHNLAIGSLKTFNMMQTDISVASFWVTNPLNDLINNHAAGGDFYAFWYEIKSHPDGPSARSDICPTGNPLGASHDNVAHSYVRFGLRIFILASRQKPCSPISTSNPSIESRFYNYMTYKIGEAGLLAQSTGNMIFDNFVVAESKEAGMKFFTAALAQKPVIVKNSAIIGISQNNAPDNLGIYGGTKAIKAPSSNKWILQDVQFFNFGSGMTILQTCSTSGTNRVLTYQLSKISYTNVTGAYLHHAEPRRSLIYDTDGTFTVNFDSTSRTYATIAPNYKHLADEPGCILGDEPSRWHSSLLCEQSVKLRGISIKNIVPQNNFNKIGMKVQKVADIKEVVPKDSTGYSEFKSLIKGKEPKDRKFTWSMPYAVGAIYNVWWLTGIHFTALSIQLSQPFQETDKAVLFRFNYTQTRQLFEIGNSGNFIAEQDSLDQDTCNFGEYTNNQDLDANGNKDPDAPNLRNLTVCLSGKDQYVGSNTLRVNGIRCRDTCPQPTPEDVQQEEIIRLWSNATQWPNGTIPQDGDNVTIPVEWTIIMDIQPAQMEFFHIDGDVTIPNTLKDVHIVAKSIWIRAGSLKAGNESVPHPGITIEIKGFKDDYGYVLSPQIGGTKLFVVHGKLFLYGPTPTTTWTKLQEYAFAGDDQITVGSVDGWAVGDQIVIAPSFSSAAQHEAVQITEINGNTIKFTPALKFDHYGSTQLTIDNQYGTLDTRAGVGHLNRKIRIISGEDEGWGFRMLVNSFIDGKVERYGHAILHGVQINAGGQYDDIQYSVLNLHRALQGAQSIQRSVFRNCKAGCLDVKNSQNVNILDNVFYEGRGHHTQALTIRGFNFKRNLMVAIFKNPFVSSGPSGCYISYQHVDSSVSVTDNLCQGAAQHGFAFGFSPCSDNFYPYHNNIAGTAGVGFIFDKTSSSCMRAKNVRAYACGIGHICSPPGTQTLRLENFIIADCGRAMTLRFGLPGTDQSAFFQDSYITAISRPDCPHCYGGSNTDCSGNHAARMLVVTVNGESMPGKSGGGFDVICKQQSLDSKAFINNVTFVNFRRTYQNLTQCSNNVIFIPHPGASDITGSHHLRDCVCQNCQLEAMAFFQPPSQAELGWAGGCGNLLCTGLNNYLVHDHTGGFLPEPGILIANNSEIGDNSENCTHVPEINGHYCTRQDFGVIEYESIAPDFNTRIMWPVYLKYDGGNWNTSTNGWKQWQWQGNQPMNKRLGRFVSVVELYQTYNMTFESQPPTDMRLQFQKREPEGDNTQFIIIKLHYPRPNSIRIRNRGKTIKPITLRDDPTLVEDLDTTLCGSNKYYWENYTVHFVLTADKNCFVRVSLTNSIQLHARFSMPIDQFYEKDGKNQFITRICAALRITDYSRVKIVGVYSGSTIVRAVIEEQPTEMDDAKEANNQDKFAQLKALQTQLVQLFESGGLEETFSDFGEMSDIGTQIHDNTIVVEDNTDPSNSNTVEQFQQETDDETVQYIEKNIGLIIGIVMGGISMVAFIFAMVIYVIRKRASITDLHSINSELQKIKPSAIDPNETNIIEKQKIFD